MLGNRRLKRRRVLKLKRLTTLVLGLLLAESLYASGYANVAAEVMPGVVNIRTKTLVRVQSSDPYEFFFGSSRPQIQESYSRGSGVVIDRSGLIVTNNHVIENAQEIDVHFANSKRRIPAKVVGRDPKTDLALLKVKLPKNSRVLDFGNSDAMRVGDIVLAVGNPFGYGHTMTSGIISAKGRVLGSGPYDRYLQTDAAIHPGNSGGPLIDVRGRVIGINSAVDEKAYGIGFAIPSSLVKQVVAQLKKNGLVRRPWLGVIGKNILSRDALNYGPGSKYGAYGVLVDNLVVNGPAHTAGVKPGDLLLKIAGRKVKNTGALQLKLHSLKIGDSVKIELYRRKIGIVKFSIKLKETPDPSELPRERDLF